MQFRYWGANNCGYKCRYTYTPPRCRTFLPLSVSLWNDSAAPYSTVWVWRVSRAGLILFYLPKLLYPYHSLLLFFFLSIGWYCEAGVFGLIGCIPLSFSLALPTSFNNNNDNNNNNSYKQFNIPIHQNVYLPKNITLTFLTISYGI